MNYPDQTRNLNPTPEARVAMIIYGRTYSEQGGGSMDFWDSLSDYNKRICKLVVECLLPDSSGSANTTLKSELAQPKTSRGSR